MKRGDRVRLTYGSQCTGVIASIGIRVGMCEVQWDNGPLLPAELKNLEPESAPLVAKAPRFAPQVKREPRERKPSDRINPCKAGISSRSRQLVIQHLKDGIEQTVIALKCGVSRSTVGRIARELREGGTAIKAKPCKPVPVIHCRQCGKKIERAKRKTPSRSGQYMESVAAFSRRKHCSIKCQHDSYRMAAKYPREVAQKMQRLRDDGATQAAIGEQCGGLSRQVVYRVLSRAMVAGV